MSGRCIFCEIVTSRLPAFVVYQDDYCMGFLDTRPLFPGHVLLVPKPHVETLAQLPAELLTPLFGVSQRMAVAVQTAMQAEGTFVAMNNTVSQSVPHLHVHVVPRRKGDGLKGFFWPRQAYRDESHMRDVQEAIAGLLL